MSRVRLAGALLGAALLAYLVHRVGVEPLLAQLSALSWYSPLLLIPYGLVAVLDTLGWRYTFGRRLPAFATLFPVRMAGEAVNLTTPTASLGGEPVKAYLLTRARVSLEEGLASVVIAKTTLVLAQGLFLFLGLGLALGLLGATSPLLRAMGVLFVLGGLGVGGLLFAQQRGFFGGGGRLLRWVGLIRGVQGRLHRLDSEIAAFYKSRRGRFGLSVLFYLLGWLAGSLEVYLALWLLGVPVDLATAVAIEAFASAIRAAGFLIPGALGVQEGGNVAICLAFGLTAGVGLAFSVVRRLRELAWAAAGFGVLVSWGALKRSRSE